MEIDKLPPEVAEAIERADAAFHHTGLFDEPAWAIIRAHLRRLAEENARLRESAQQIERECLEAWKQATHSRSCATVAEAERDALKARIAEAWRAMCREDGGLVGPSLIAYMAEEDVGKTFALLKLEGGERE